MKTDTQKDKASPERLLIRRNFSEVVIDELAAQEKSKRWLYNQLNMTAQSFDSRLDNNDWRLDEIIKITTLLNLNG